MITSFITVLTIGQCLFTAHLLALRVKYTSVYKPLSVLFLVVVLMHLYHLVRDNPDASITALVVPEITLAKQSLEISLAPLFWLYVRELTSEKALGLKLNDVAHFLTPLMSAFFISGGLWLWFELPIFQSDSAGQGNFICHFNEVLNVLILLQILIYSALTLKRLSSYQRGLKQLFSNTSNSIELIWVRWVALSIIGAVFLEVSAQYFYIVVNDTPAIARTINSILRAALFWLLAIWGLRQRPELFIELNKADEPILSEKKYKKSTLSTVELAGISEKIREAVEQDKLYRDPNLSLRSLSEKISVVPNYVSQALSTQMNESFFDYINGFRVKDAEIRLKTTNDKVKTIASDVGFNSRSSFYTAFKKVTNQTPAAFRQANA